MICFPLENWKQELVASPKNLAFFFFFNRTCWKMEIEFLLFLFLCVFKKCFKPGVVILKAPTFNTRSRGISEFKARLVSVVSSRSSRNTWWDSVSTKQANKQKKNVFCCFYYFFHTFPSLQGSKVTSGSSSIMYCLVIVLSAETCTC